MYKYFLIFRLKQKKKKKSPSFVFKNIAFYSWVDNINLIVIAITAFIQDRDFSHANGRLIREAGNGWANAPPRR